MSAPVRLTAIERDNHEDGFILLQPSERDALCRALRIAVRGLDQLADPKPTANRHMRAAAILREIAALVDVGEDGGK